MGIRHKAVKETLEKGTHEEWNDDHEVNYQAVIHHQDIFLDFGTIAEWNAAQNTSGTNPTITLVGGFVCARLAATGGVGNFGTIRHELVGAAADITNHTAQPILHMALDIQTPTADNATHEFGFMANAGLPFAANQNGAFFRIDNNVLFAVSSDGAAETTTDLGAPNQFGNYKVKHTATADTFFVDDNETPVATHTTNISAADLTIKLTCADRAAGDNYLNCQATCLCTLRQTA